MSAFDPNEPEPGPDIDVAAEPANGRPDLAALVDQSLAEIFASQPDDPPPHTWTPIDLIGRALAPPEPPTIGGLCYPGRRHLFSGEPESLKSWAAMILCAEQIAAGGQAAYIDFEMGAAETLARLRALRIPDAALRAQFIYIEPAQPFWDGEIRDDTDQLLLERCPSLIIIDAFTGALQTHGLDPNKSVDIELFYRGVADPLRARGAAVVVLDHLPKDPANRGKFAIGSERKVGGVEVHIGFEPLVPFGRGRIGRVKLTTHKDRPGWLPRPRAADLELRSGSNGEVTWQWHEPENADGSLGETTPFRPTVLMERVSRWLQERGTPVTLHELRDNVLGRKDWVTRAAAQLAAEGYAAEREGPRRARMFEHIKPYREADDEAQSNLENDLPPLAPDLPPGQDNRPAPAGPPLTGGRSITGASRTEDLPPPEQGQDSEPLDDPDADIPF